MTENNFRNYDAHTTVGAPNFMYPFFCNVPLIFRVLKLQNNGPPLYKVNGI